MSKKLESYKLHNFPTERSGAGRRTLSLYNGTVPLEFKIAKETKDMPDEMRKQLMDYVLEVVRPKFETPIVTSGETLQSWGSAREPGKPYLGSVIVANVPVTCIGMPVNDRTLSILNERGYLGQNRKHERAYASGLTYGTLFMKKDYTTGKDGKRIVKSFRLCFISNCLLDLFVGKMDSRTYVRAEDLWPNEWCRTGNNVNRSQNRSPRGNGNRRERKRRAGTPANVPRSKKGKANTAKRSSLVGVRMVQDHLTVNEGVPDWKKVTLTMLRAAAKEIGIPSSGNKADLIERVVAFADQDGTSLY